ncbi:MAG: tRNA lysidine(34) synthetase TilS [Bacteroidales bacterium]
MRNPKQKYNNEDENLIAGAFRKMGIPASSAVLVAVSGGLDSVALLHMFVNSGIKTGIAHVNFNLRGEESDGDEAFVKALAEKYCLPFYCRHFNTEDHAKQQGISIQMAARSLRYRWFEEIAAQYEWDFVATAHHLDDQIETFFINLLRGTGIGGLKGIAAKSGIFIRPLIDTPLSTIEEYVKNHNLCFREDSSNISNDYLRNRIRHQLIPVFDELQPLFRKIMAGNLKLLTETESFFRNEINKLKSEIITQHDAGLELSITKLIQTGFPGLLLYEILKEYGFTTDQAQFIFQSVDAQPGKTFYSSSHRLVKDREVFILQSLSETGISDSEFIIEEGMAEIFAPLHLEFQIQRMNTDFQVIADPNKAFLDFDTLVFPLKIRKWKQGDRIKPFGMKGQMKISDFFTANKFSIADKERTWLLTDAHDHIVWIIGYRIADQNRIKSTTQTAFVITINGSK